MKHALLSASSAERWLNCPGSARFCEKLPNKETVYSREGTLAHEFCAVEAKRILGLETAKNSLKKLEKKEGFDVEMKHTASQYAEFLKSLYDEYESPPSVFIEQVVDFSNVVPEGYGTCDCMFIGGSVLHVVDYKHGKGVSVSAYENPQMLLYALGALNFATMLYNIETIRVTIFQPRIKDEPDTFSITKSGLLAWGESIKADAKAAFEGSNEFRFGDWCRFCPGSSSCSTLADEVDDLFITRRDEIENTELVAGLNQLSRERVAGLLARGERIKKWLDVLEKWTRDELLSGGVVPGLKLVEGRSTRAISDFDEAAKIAEANGIAHAMLYEQRPISMTDLEKLMGKKVFEEKMAPVLTRTEGKPTVVPESDKRPAIGSGFEAHHGA